MTYKIKVRMRRPDGSVHDFWYRNIHAESDRAARRSARRFVTKNFKSARILKVRPERGAR